MLKDTMADTPRLIEHAFPLKQASLDSVHEKNVRHGHISTLHIWPARRPLAACRAALIATLLPDPSAEPRPEGLSDAQWCEQVRKRRQELCERIGGRVVTRIERKRMPNGQVVERQKEETEGGILHWGRETDNADTLEWFRQEIRKAYGGRAPKVLDPFAGGGAIPLETMRLGCEATAIDINPVAWFILKCTLEYPHRLAGQTRPLPDFILHDDEFMREYFTTARKLGKREMTAAMHALHQRLEKRTKTTPEMAQSGLPFGADTGTDDFQADLAWHVRAWGRWVLARARKDLAHYYPTYGDFEPLDPGKIRYEPQPMRLVPLKDDGTADIAALNGEFSEEYLADKRNPRWIAKPTVAYLWARTVTCKNCRATIPLLKTRWLSKKANRRVLLTLRLNAERTHVDFGIDTDVPIKGGNAAQRREHDRRVGAGTMSAAGAQCVCCSTIMTMEDIRVAGESVTLGATMTAVVCDGPTGKTFRLPTNEEQTSSESPRSGLESLFKYIPFGAPDEPMPSAQALGMRAQLYGFHRWRQLFAPRQAVAVTTFVRETRAVRTGHEVEPDRDWREAVFAGLAVGVDRLADRQSTICRWDMGYTKLQGTFTRFALPITWDYCEGNPLSSTTGNYLSNLEWVAEYFEHAMDAVLYAPVPRVIREDSARLTGGKFDAIVTDPPYYDAIPYSDLMDFFYVWLRRTLHGVSAEFDSAFADSLGPKWNAELGEGELIDDASRHSGDGAKSTSCYENGMARVFEQCFRVLSDDGRFVVVFAHKQPAAWETLASAIVKAGFVVDGSWPIRTEMGNRTRALTGAALASSVWLVCRKRPSNSRSGWDSSVLGEMRQRIATQLREFWDAGIRGPDFVWAATGPALEAYSKHPVVKKADHPDEIMTVAEFLTHVRRMVVDFVVGRVLSGDAGSEDQAAGDKLDEPTAYYLLHRNDFGLEDAPAGTCILYAVSCGLSDKELVDTWDILARTSGAEGGEDEVDEENEDGSDADAAEVDEGSGSKLKLKTWSQRKGRSMGYEAPGGRPIPLVDRVHRLMHLWKAQDVHKVDEYLDDNALRRNELFKRFLQSLIELSPRGSEERSLLESLSSHVGAKGAKHEEPALPLAPVEDEP